MLIAFLVAPLEAMASVRTPPLGWNTSWDGFNPYDCPGGKPPELCPGGTCPALCTNGVGNVRRNAPCQWPFTYDGTTYDGTTGGVGTAHGGYGYYVKPWNRAQPYLIGIVLGYILHK